MISHDFQFLPKSNHHVSPRMAKFSCLNPHVSPCFTIFHRLHNHFPDENIPTVAASTFGRMLKVWLAAAAWDAQSGEHCVFFQWRLRWFAKHLTITSFVEMGLSENRVYSQLEPFKNGIMIRKTIGFRGTQHFQTHPNVKPWFFNVWHGLTMKNLRNHRFLTMIWWKKTRCFDRIKFGKKKNVVDPCGEFTEKIYMQLAGACPPRNWLGFPANVPFNEFSLSWIRNSTLIP